MPFAWGQTGAEVQTTPREGPVGVTGGPPQLRGRPRRRGWPGESQGQRSLVGFRLWGRTESDTTEAI